MKRGTVSALSQNWFGLALLHSAAMYGWILLAHALTGVPVRLPALLFAVASLLLVNIPMVALLKRDRSRAEAGLPGKPWSLGSCWLTLNAALLIHLLVRDGIFQERFEALILLSGLPVTLIVWAIGVLMGRDRQVSEAIRRRAARQQNER